MRNNPTWIADILCLLILTTIFYFLWLGHYPLFTPDEGRYAEIGLEMVKSKNYVTPHMNGIIFLDKPILHFWLQALGIHWFGVNEWAIRFFPAFFGLLGIIFTYICGRHLFNRKTALLAAIILATTPLYFVGAHYANLDLEVAVLMSCSLLSLITFIQNPQNPRIIFLMIAYITAAFAFLAKGLIGVVFPIIIAGTWICILWRWDLIKKLHIIPGFLLMFALIAPWYFFAYNANPLFFHYFFIEQQVLRFLSAAEFSNKMPFWFFIPVTLIGFFPWTVLLFSTLVQTIKKIHQPKLHQTELFLFLWTLIVLIFFSLPRSKLVGYIFPIFPPLALLTANYLSTHWNIQKKRVFIFCTLVSTSFLLVLVFNAARLNQKSTKPLAQYLKGILHSQDQVVSYFNYFHDMPLYLEQPITIVADWNSPNIAQKDNWKREFWIGMKFQKNHEQLLDEKAFWHLWLSPKKIYVLVNNNRLDQFKIQAKKYFVAATYKNTLLISNQPLQPRLG